MVKNGYQALSDLVDAANIIAANGTDVRQAMLEYAQTHPDDVQGIREAFSDFENAVKNGNVGEFFRDAADEFKECFTEIAGTVREVYFEDIEQPEHLLENEPQEMGENDQAEVAKDDVWEVGDYDKTEAAQNDVWEMGDYDQTEATQNDVWEVGDYDKTEAAKDDSGTPDEPEQSEKDAPEIGGDQ